MFFGSMQDTGCCSMLDARCLMLDIGFLMFDTGNIINAPNFPSYQGGVSRGTEMFWSKIMCEGGGGFWKDAGYSILDS
jgi:hypothetical protein